MLLGEYLIIKKYKMKKLTQQELIQFEEKVGDCFKNKMIYSPIHLYHGNEKEIISVFDNINDDDWVFCTWRSHYQCLLKGVSEEQLLQDIINGRSIALCYPEYNIFSSAIVSGIIPIANGVALSIKKQNKTNRVFCFIGDMTSETGCFHENYKYSINFDLPITWVIEDNGRSTCTDTKKTWNTNQITYSGNNPKILYYTYTSKYPHSGVGERIQF